jgi:hypothetical protein
VEANHQNCTADFRFEVDIDSANVIFAWFYHVRAIVFDENPQSHAQLQSMLNDYNEFKSQQSRLKKWNYEESNI